jgi:DNA-binding CsgD family transcriptional regulator
VEGLRQKDVKNLLLAVSKVYSGMERETLPERTISAVGAALSCDFICFDSFGSDDNYLDTQWHNDPALLTPIMAETFGRIFNADPSKHPNAVILSDPSVGAIKFSDSISRTDFRKTELYNDYFKRVDIEENMSIAFPLGNGLTITCSTTRRLADFNERDRLVLSLLAPHLANSIRHSIEFKKMREREARLERLLYATSSAIICLMMDGGVIEATASAGKLLTKYFGRGIREGDFLPEDLHVWVNVILENPFADFTTPPVFLTDMKGSQLRVEPILNFAAGEITLLLHEETMVSKEQFSMIGLTNRESEILYWISEGKTDEVIGTLCGISQRTVQKHVEHIFQKLNVETRTAAVRVATDTIMASGNEKIVL